MNALPDKAAAVLRLLGAQRLRCHSREVDLPVQLPGALLLRLAMEPDWLARDTLTLLFWPDAPRDAGQHNLRVQVHRLRQWLGAQGWASALRIERMRLRLEMDSDVQQLRRALRVQDWPAALGAWGGPLAPSLVLRGAFPAFEDWLTGEREALASGWRHALAETARALAAQGRRDRARSLLLSHLHEDDPAEDLLQTLLELSDDAEPALARRVLDLVQRFQRRSEQRHGVPALPRTLTLAAALSRVAFADPVPHGAPQAHDRLQPIARAADAEPMWLARGDLVQRFSRSAGRWQLVEAEPGAGKTRLMREAAGASVLVWLACRESERDDALAPLRRWWRQAAAELSGSPWWVEHGAMLATELAQCWSEGGSPPMADEEALRVDDSLGSPQDGSRSAGDRRRAGAPPVRPRGWMRSARWHRTLDLAARALIALAQRLGQPVAIDDLQWADGATLGLLRAMARLQASPSADAGPSVWLALRPHETEPALLRWLDSRRLEGLLDRHAMEGLSAAELLPWLGGDAEAARRLHRASGGNPFFAWRLLCWRGVEGLRACADEAATPSDAAPGRPGLPVELLGMVERRVAGLGDTARRVLAVAAVAGDARDVEALASLVSAVPWTVAGALAQAEAAGLLRGHEFVHDIVREAIVAGLPQARRTVLHTGIARRMAVLWPPERLAPHAWAAGDAEAAVEAVRLADERDRQRGAHQCAAGRARRWRRALRAANDTTAAALSDGLRARLEAVLACDLARTDFELGALERSRARLAEVFLSPTEPELRVEAWVLRAEIALHEGTVASAEAALAEARALHKPTAALWRMQATVAHLRGDYSSAERAFDRLVRHLRRGPPGAPLVQALTSLGAARDRALGPGTGLPLHEEAWSVAARLGARHLQVNAALNIVEAQQQQGRVDQALRWADAAMALGEFEATPALVNNLSAALLRAGRLDEARLWTQRLEHHARPALRCLARARLLRIAAAQGRAVEVAERAPALLSAMADTDDYAAQAAGVATLLEHAGTEHHPAALAFVKPLPLHAQVRTWLDLALAKRGHAQARFLGSDVSNERSSPECRVPTSTG